MRGRGPLVRAGLGQARALSPPARQVLGRLLRLARTARNDPEVFAGLVHACRYCGLLEASEAAHREARRLDPHISTSVFMYGTCQARAGNGGPALATLRASVDGGFAAPQALRIHPWLAPLRGEATFASLVERAEASRRLAAKAFHEAGGPALLGV